MARALGFRFFSDAKELTDGVGQLQDLTKIEIPVEAGVLATQKLGEGGSPANSKTPQEVGDELAHLKKRRPTRLSLQRSFPKSIAAPSPGATRSPSRSCAAAGPTLPKGEDRGEGNSISVILGSLPRIIAAADVRNPLLGKNGATRVFGPQKGAALDEIDALERSLAKLADVVSKDFKLDYRDEPGAGAAGGLGFGLMSFCGAKIRPGFDVVAEVVDLESKIEAVDVVITGEGSLDRQTLEGKTPAGVARLAHKLGKRIFAIVGREGKDREVREMFDRVYELNQPGINEKEQLARAGELLREKARELGQMLKKTSNPLRH
jgi:glycerate kinase